MPGLKDLSKQSPPFSLTAIDHIVLRTIDIEPMMAFYTRVLGATLERKLEDLGLYQLRAGNSIIDLVDAVAPLGKAGGDIPDGRAPNVDHFCLRISPWDESALRSHLLEHGVTGSEIAERYGAEGFGPSLYIQDPEGNTVELKADAD